MKLAEVTCLQKGQVVLIKTCRPIASKTYANAWQQRWEIGHSAMKFLSKVNQGPGSKYTIGNGSGEPGSGRRMFGVSSANLSSSLRSVESNDSARSSTDSTGGSGSGISVSSKVTPLTVDPVQE